MEGLFGVSADVDVVRTILSTAQQRWTQCDYDRVTSKRRSGHRERLYH